MSNIAQNRRIRELFGRAMIIVGLLIGMTASAYVVWIWWGFFDLPRGTPVRPMNQAALTVFIAGWTALFGLPASICGLILSRGWWRWLGVMAILLCLAPIPVGQVVFDSAASARGLCVEE